ncbi:toll/interleukin-1 receptor domain-containing protein [Paraburkholderia hospita]|uniref:toll/interleukin-1 receptor domain-containing protein n=1 Tax=Paraburkholderia hospita TaxID=169430 RepID=UPI000B34216D|nr:TIR domain-containing protein [Paraburkholderia hospita]OUL72729.1 hypothetical protein CA603_45200 [Paraburkholderia hospita]
MTKDVQSSGVPTPPDADAAGHYTHSVFLSYSRKDEAQVVALDAALAAAGNVDVLRDKEDISPAEDWRARVESLIVAADAFVFCMSPDALASEVVAWEISVAIRLSKRIVPVVLRDGGTSPPADVARLNYVFLTSAAAWDAGLAKLLDAITADLDWVREHTRLGSLAQRWEAHGRPRDELLRGAALIAAEAWLAGQPGNAPAPSSVHGAFIAASRQNATRRQRIIVSVAIGVAVLALGLSALAYWQRGIAIAQRTQATARQLAAEAQVVLADPLADGARATRDLLISQKLSPSAAAQSALERAIRRLPPRLVGRIPLGDAGPGAIRFDPSGRWIALANTAEVIFWDVGTRALRFRYVVEGGETRPEIAFTADGARALVIRRRPFPVAGAIDADVIDLDAKPPLATHVAGVLDAAVEGGSVLFLRARDDGVAVVDQAGDTVVQRIAHAVPISTARFSAPPASLFEAGMPPMTPFAATPKQAPLVVLVDVAGGLSVAERGADATARALPEASGSAAIALDTDGGHLALRSPETGDRVIPVTGGKPLWTARAGAKSFLGFLGGSSFISVAGAAGARLESLAAGVALRLSDARRTDWDLAGMTDLDEYNAIVSVAFAHRGDLLVTGRSDGRITVWRPGLAQRFGAVGAIPLPNFERVASFDQGDAFGTQKPFWTAPQNLFVSDDGRYIASQSLGLETNAVGGVVKLDPVIRVWDVRHNKETARLKPAAPTVVAFADDRPLMAMVDPAPRETPTAAATPAISIWDLASFEPLGTETRETLYTVTIDASAPKDAMPRKRTGKKLKPSVQQDASDASPDDTATKEIPAATIASMQMMAEIQGAWLGADFKLRARPDEGDRIVILDDFSERADRMIADAAATSGGGMSADDLKAQLSRFAAGTPDLPLLMPLLTVSRQGTYVFAAIGHEVRVYSLGDNPRLLRTFEIGDASGRQIFGITGAPDGEAVAVMFARVAAMREGGLRAAPFLPAQIGIYRADRSGPVATMAARLLRTPALPMPADHVLALAPGGDRILMARLTLDTKQSGPPQLSADIIVRNLKFDAGQPNAEVVLRHAEIPPAQAMTMVMGSRGDDATMGGFDATGDSVALVALAPDCPMRTVITGALLPVQVPSCAPQRATVSVLDARTGATRNTEQFLVPGQEATAGMPADPMMAMATGMGGAPSSAVVTFASAKGPVIALVRRVVQTKQNDQQMQLSMQRHRVVFTFDGENRINAAACARLPDAAATLSADAWATVVPAEPYQSVCDSHR